MKQWALVFTAIILFIVTFTFLKPNSKPIGNDYPVEVVPVFNCEVWN